MRSISTSDWAKEEYTEPEQDQVLFHRLFPEWVPCISLHRHYRLSERGIYGELPLPENEISSKQGKRSCDGFPCLCWHWPIFPSRRQPSIFGTAELNFRVRNGNGWTLCVCSTDLNIPFRKMLIKNRIEDLADLSARNQTHSRPEQCCSSPRSISIGQLNTLLCLHLRPIKLVVYKRPYPFGGISYLEACFTLRCFQRLSLPHAATQLCSWQNNWCTGGASDPVLSY